MLRGNPFHVRALLEGNDCRGENSTDYEAQGIGNLPEAGQIREVSVGYFGCRGAVCLPAAVGLRPSFASHKLFKSDRTSAPLVVERLLDGKYNPWW